MFSYGVSYRHLQSKVSFLINAPPVIVIFFYSQFYWEMSWGYKNVLIIILLFIAQIRVFRASALARLHQRFYLKRSGQIGKVLRNPISWKWSVSLALNLSKTRRTLLTNCFLCSMITSCLDISVMMTCLDPFFISFRCFYSKKYFLC